MRRVLGTLLIAAVVAGPIMYEKAREKRMRNFRVVREGVLYRSGQFSESGLRQAVAERGIKTVVSFRYADDGEAEAPDAAEERVCRQLGVRHVRVRPRAWSSPDGDPPADRSVAQFLKVMHDESARPVLIHCFAGVHRTGAFNAIYRMEFEGWTPAAAMRELYTCGYTNLGREWDITEYIAAYRPGRKPLAD